jgi:hypothetical protein
MVKPGDNGCGISAAHLKKRFNLEKMYEPRKEGILIVLKPTDEIAKTLK